ncbi:SUKH-4 family immunity protein [Streptomyces yaanensis]|uniref:SUKH-4 family immunity protein n=1 Tax=Streptomyces yaanensis TaxID=1142239 RepID=A0ABV7SR04_9ACTN|nr:SUKH-4 family immunity protein [Streptomyces sp. CGMCC 4.7035]WNC02006.1 SUKH-4 family immunity protein [Streptomyces sp. CGMCC 4.7035]
MTSEKLNMVEISYTDEILENWTLRIPGEAVYEVYRPVETLERVTVDGRDLILFGSTGVFGRLMVDVASGVVLEKLEGYSDVSLVNTSLEAFNRCLEVFAAKMPLLEIDDEEEAEEVDREIAKGLEEDVRRIDPEAYVENSFWYEIRWSVAIGDFRG